MDPNVTLDELRTLMVQFRDDSDDQRRVFVAEMIVERIESLDDWVSRGGFLPTDWNVNR